jgi:hypothetical protein
MLISTTPFVFPFLNTFYDLYTSKVDGNPDYDWPSFWDLKTAITTCVLCFFIKNAILKFMTPISYNLMRDSYVGPEREERAKRSAVCAMKGIYFIAITCFGYIVLKDAEWFPVCLGGSGDAALTFEGYPYYNYLEKAPLIRGYMMIQLGYHLFSLLAHITGPQRNDFMEMLLHHVITVVLIMTGYLMNFQPMSSLILFVHDICDIFVYICRAFLDTKYIGIGFMFYIMLMTSFAYFRLYVYPFHLIWHSVWFNTTTYMHIPGFRLMGALVHFLLCLHVYWYVLLA